MSLSDFHKKLITESAISEDVANARGYRTVTRKIDLAELGFASSQRNVPALVIPLYGVTGQLVGYQSRPDSPRMNREGKPVKYETKFGQQMVIDIHPSSTALLRDPRIPLALTEGIRKGDSGVTNLHIAMISLLGVWNWRDTNDQGGKVVNAEFESIALNGRPTFMTFDSDWSLNPSVYDAMDRLGHFLKSKGADVQYVLLPDGDHGEKVGLDDYLAKGFGLADIKQLCRREVPRPKVAPPTKPVRQPAQRKTLADVVSVFQRWLNEPDADGLAVIMASVIANRIVGDPVWLLVVAPPSSGKTEMIQSLSIFDDVQPTQRLTPAAFMSGTSSKERTKDATGGILPTIGARGILINKDFGSVLTANKDSMAEILQALRDIFDGHYVRDVGVDGGRKLQWNGHCGFIGGVTDVIDNHHQIISQLGDRYLLLRPKIGDGERQANRAIMENGHETPMREELTQAVAGLIDHVDIGNPEPLDDEERQSVARIAHLVVRCRSTVIREGYGREVIDVPEHEQPARLAKQLAKLLQSLRMIGVSNQDAVRITKRVALDSMPRNRRTVIEYLRQSGTSFLAYELAPLIGMAPTTTARVLEDLALLGVANQMRGDPTRGTRYAIADWTVERWPTT